MLSPCFFKKSNYFFNRQLGFTIIELLVAVAIIAVLTTIGIASYANFNQKKVVDSVTEEIKTNLRLIQSKAVNNEKSCNQCQGADLECGTSDDLSLEGWYADFVNNQYYGKCERVNPAATATFGAKTLVNFDLNNNGVDDVYLSGASGLVIKFEPLGGTDLSAGQLIITVNSVSGSYNNYVTVTRNGDIE